MLPLTRRHAGIISRSAAARLNAHPPLLLDHDKDGIARLYSTPLLRWGSSSIKRARSRRGGRPPGTDLNLDVDTGSRRLTCPGSAGAPLRLVRSWRRSPGQCGRVDHGGRGARRPSFGALTGHDLLRHLCPSWRRSRRRRCYGDDAATRRRARPLPLGHSVLGHDNAKMPASRSAELLQVAVPYPRLTTASPSSGKGTDVHLGRFASGAARHGIAPARCSARVRVCRFVRRGLRIAARPTSPRACLNAGGTTTRCGASTPPWRARYLLAGHHFPPSERWWARSSRGATRRLLLPEPGSGSSRSNAAPKMSASAARTCAWRPQRWPLQCHREMKA